MPRMVRATLFLGICLALLLTACEPLQRIAGAEPTAPALSLVNLPLPTPGAAVTPGPVVELVVPPTPTPTPTLAAGAAEDAALIERGESIYAQQCATCHGTDGAGQGDYPALGGSAFVTAADPAPVIETVLQGRGEMPAFEDTLSNQQIAAVVSYIRQAWGNNAAAVTVERVRNVTRAGGE